ncbi:hypothetical protein N7474_000649 [Penicillium riverlandense]|uniref:uncharacterized protein n=1 Tax=Penicillium riverlandense TaxID=1903569 RepID=UPI002547D93E|nr:uncharacterized protein N7474_000649 [Penicillium riverlandense]KAJ5832338.1 hypothetical protein N7474_000649 [Penicillium riverlandense]
MESPQTTISGDLPIRLARPKQLSPVQETEESTQSVDIQGMAGTLEPKPQPGVDPKFLEDEAAGQIDVSTILPENKKKGNRKPKSKRGRNAPTGFEDFYADPPVTPAEYQELRGLYDPSRSFADRIDEALMRFQKNRRLDSERSNVFLKYLQYGGVTVGPNVGGGVAGQDLKAMDQDEALRARSATAVFLTQSKLEVDFNDVVRGYLSSYFPFYFLPDDEYTIKLATVTIRNFLSYLLHHDVCPEYKDNIDQARKICVLAEIELLKNQQLVSAGPGYFNQSCSMLFGGYHFDNPPNAEQAGELSYDAARKVAKFAIAGCGTNEQASRFRAMADNDTLSAMKVEDIDGFEILGVTEPDAETIGFYKSHASDLVPVGKIHAKAFRDPGKPDLDLSPEERWKWNHGNEPLPEFDFFLEVGLLSYCYPGMKVMTSVWEVSCGLHYFDEIISVYTSFYTVLGNDMMVEWKKPVDLMGQDVDDVVDAL